MGSLFGTDGIRGVANEYPITPEVAISVGRAACAVLKKNHRIRIVIGKDSRQSGDMIAMALASGICAMGGDVYMAGVMPTPGVAFLTQATESDAGIVVSASHNPFYDNGIKIFDHRGFKLTNDAEAAIERHVHKSVDPPANTTTGHIGMVREMDDPENAYVHFLKKNIPEPISLKQLKIVLDCSNGATSRIAPRVFTELGADVTVLFDRPDGKNINEGCGSQHLETLKKTVLTEKADIGLAFDGDGDRLIAVDENGNAATGDQILAICARYMKQRGWLAGNCVVSTVMSNVGLKNALSEMGITHIETDVGDRNVLAAMQENGAVVGGEDSGHMIFLDHHTSGDGIYTGLRLLEVILATQTRLSALSNIVRIYPQVLKNVTITQRTDLMHIPEIAAAIEGVEKRLGKEGRVLVRYSGTQPLCRVMVEGPDARDTEKYCQSLVDVISRHLGSDR